MNIQTLVVAARTNLKDHHKPFLDIRLQVTQFLLKIRNLVGDNRLDDETVKTGLKSLQSLLGNHLSLPYINFIWIPNQKSGNLVICWLHSGFSVLFKKKWKRFRALHRCTIYSTDIWNGDGCVSQSN